nr:hypothetical protein [Aeromonas veronii]
MEKRRGRLCNSEDVSLLLAGSDSLPLFSGEGGQQGCPFILRSGNKLFIRSLIGHSQESAQAIRPVELTATMESGGVDPEEGRGAFRGVIGIITIQNGAEKAPRCGTLLPGLLGVSLGHLILETPLAGVLGSELAILNGAAMLKARLWKVGQATSPLPRLAVDVLEEAGGYMLVGEHQEVIVRVEAVLTMGNLKSADIAKDL